MFSGWSIWGTGQRNHGDGDGRVELELKQINKDDSTELVVIIIELTFIEFLPVSIIRLLCATAHSSHKISRRYLLSRWGN